LVAAPAASADCVPRVLSEMERKGMSAGMINRRTRTGMGIRVSDAAGGYRAAYAGLYLFTLLLYLRPQDLAPALGAIPLAKMAIIATFAAYLISKLNASENLVRWTLELYMLLSIAALAIIHIPFAASPQESVATL